MTPTSLDLSPTRRLGTHPGPPRGGMRRRPDGPVDERRTLRLVGERMQRRLAKVRAARSAAPYPTQPQAELRAPQ